MNLDAALTIPTQPTFLGLTTIHRSNGNYQIITPTKPVHELLHKVSTSGEAIEFFPAHPHEGGVGVPSNAENARVIATGKSKISDRSFNLAVVFESTEDAKGRAVTESTFHHFADYNWDVEKGCPSFVEESPGDGMKNEPRALEDIKTYVRNLALWLARKTDGEIL